MMSQRHDGASLYATTDLAALQHRVQEELAERILYVTDAGQAGHFEDFFEVGKDAGWGDGLSHIDGQTNQPTMVDVQVRENLNADRCLFASDAFLCLSPGDHRASMCSVALRFDVAFHGSR